MMVALASDPSVVARVEPTFLMLGALHGQPVLVDDLVPYSHDDYNSTGPFYLLIALSLGSYLPVTLLTLARPEVSLLRALLASLVLGTISALVVAAAGTVVYGVAAGHLPALLGVGLWYCFAVSLVGIGLRSLTGVVAPAIVTLLFAILNFPSSGGSLAPALLPPIFVWCHDVLPGAAFVEIMRSTVYFGGADIGHALVVLGAWSASGGVLTAVAAGLEHRHGRDAVGAGAGRPGWSRPARAAAA